MNVAEYERMFQLEDSYWWFVARHRLIEAILCSLYGEKDNERTILDIGCGTGAMSARLQKWGRVVSADFSPLALEFSRRRGLRNLVTADAMKMPFAEESFDLLIAMDMLEHLPDDVAALKEFHRVLKPQGRIIVTVPAYRHLWSEHDIALMHHRRYLRQELASRATSVGFTIEKLSHTMTMLYPIVALQRKLNASRPHQDPPRAAMPILPESANALMTELVCLENLFARRLNFPFGVTILCIARKG